MEKTKQELLKEANDELSQHCFERGRIHYEIEQDGEALEKKKLRAHNMDVDFKKVSARYRKALEEARDEKAMQAAVAGIAVNEKDAQVNAALGVVQ